MNLFLILSLSAAGLVVLGAPLYFAFRSAAEGYQDADGFHLGVEPKPVELPVMAMPLPTASAAAPIVVRKAVSEPTAHKELVDAGSI